MRRNPLSAFSLIEVTLAIGVIATCLIATLGLLPVAAKTNQVVVQQTTANDILSKVMADFRDTPKSAGNSSKQYKILFPNNRNNPSYIYFSNEGSTGKKPDTDTANATFLVTVTYMVPPAGALSRTATLFHIKVSWPYSGTTNTTPQGSVESFLSLDRN